MQVLSYALVWIMDAVPNKIQEISFDISNYNYRAELLNSFCGAADDLSGVKRVAYSLITLQRVTAEDNSSQKEAKSNSYHLSVFRKRGRGVT
eukprot:IDg9977t1